MKLRLAAAFVVLILGAIQGAHADTTGSGNAANGQTQFNASCTGAGCHSLPPDVKRLNAANAGDVIVRAVAQMRMDVSGRPAFNPNDIAAHLATYLTNPPPVVDVAFKGSTPITFPDISLGATITMMQTVTPAPTKGSISGYVVNSATVTYTHNTCTVGTDTVKARGISTTTPPAAASTSPRTVTINIKDPTTGPTLTPSGGETVPATTGTLFTYPTVSTCPELVTWSLSGAPSWLSIDSSGVVSGFPEGTSASFTVKATYPGLAAPSTSKTVTVIISPGGPPPPAVTSPATASGLVDVQFAYQITANNNPTSFAVTGLLPPGLDVNNATGLISGKPTIAGVYPVTVSAANATPPPASKTVTFTITSDVGAPIAQDVTIEVPSGAATPIPLPISGQFTQVTILGAPTHGTAPTPAAGNSTVIYTSDGSYTGADSFTYNVAGPGGTSQTATVNITVVLRPPAAQAATLTVPLNTPTTIDLRAFITGSGLTGVAIATDASHGTTEVNGSKVTYTPRQNYFGPDTFTYVAFGNVGASSPAVVTVTVVGRPDPSKDVNVVGLVSAQSQVARRFARAQISNYQRRMESLHVDPPNSDAAPARAGVGPADHPVTSDAPRLPAASQKAGERPGSGVDVVASDVQLTTNGFLRTAGGLASPGSSPASASAQSILPASWVNSIVSMAQSGTVNLANSTDRGSAPAGVANGFGLWAGGYVSFGTRDSSERSAGSQFSTDGITIGGDWRASNQLVLGIGVGYAQDKSHFGDDGTKMKSDGTSIAAYASYQPTRSTFIDALLGYGTLNFDSDRHVASVDQFAFANRDGHQFFGSVAAGFEYRTDRLLLSPYGRLDFTYDKLKQVSETGAGLNALTYRDQTQHAFQGSLGLRAESQHATDFGWVRPRVRAEYRHDFEGGGDATITYADQFGGLAYSVAPVGTKRNFLLLGAGGDFIFRGGLRLGIDYQWQSSGGADSGQAFRFLLSQELDGKGWPFAPWSSRPLANAVRVDGGYTFDDNVTRGRVDDEILSDKIYSLNVETSRTVYNVANTRAFVTGLLHGENFHTYTGLARVSGGLQGELQYRGSADFDAVTFAAFARGWLDGYRSHLRDGGRVAVGVSARRSLTDRIDVYGELSANWRRAQSDVFDLTDYVARLNFDYSLGRNGTFYLNGEFHRGDTVSDGKASLVNLSIADVFVRDDAFPGKDLFAYRFDARTWVGTLGYNFPLGPRDSIDFSWRRVQSKPTAHPSFDAGSLRYVDNQYSVLYLIRF